MEALCDLAGIEYHGGKKTGSARQTKEKNNTAQSQSGNAESYDPFKDPEKAQKRRRLASLRGADERRDRGNRNASRFYRPKASLSLLSEACSSAPTPAKAAPGSSPIAAAKRSGAAAGWQAMGAHRRLKAWTLPGSIGALPIGFMKPATFRISLLSKEGRIFSRLSILHGAQPPRRKPSR